MVFGLKRPFGKRKPANIAADPKQSAGKPTADTERLRAMLDASPDELDAMFKADAAAYVQRQRDNIAERWASRKLVEPNAEERNTLDTMKLRCLGVRHVFPPHHPKGSYSFLGGEPIMAPDDDWPMAYNTKGVTEHIPFVAQIDCSDLPDGEGRSLLPDKGILYFFAPVSSNLTPEYQMSAVRYNSKTPTAKWAPVSIGAVASFPPLTNDRASRYGLPTARDFGGPNGRYAHHYPQCFIEFGWISGVTTEANAQGYPWEVAAKQMKQDLLAFHGPAPSGTPQSWQEKPEHGVWRPNQAFPESWYAIRMTAWLVKHWIEQERKSIDPETAHHGPLFDRVQAGFNELTTPAFRPFEIPSEETTDQFFGLLEMLVDDDGFRPATQKLPAHMILNRILEDVAIESAEACLQDEHAAARISPAVIDALRSRHYLLRDIETKDRYFQEHQIFGQGRDVQGGCEELAQTHLLLFRIGWDQAVGVEVGDAGCWQYWITPADLAARRFENVTVTFECH